MACLVWANVCVYVFPDSSLCRCRRELGQARVVRGVGGVDACTGAACPRQNHLARQLLGRHQPRTRQVSQPQASVGRLKGCTDETRVRRRWIDGTTRAVEVVGRARAWGSSVPQRARKYWQGRGCKHCAASSGGRQGGGQKRRRAALPCPSSGTTTKVAQETKRRHAVQVMD